jgi:formylglycine-generating enzyme required for sulfatase activity
MQVENSYQENSMKIQLLVLLAAPLACTDTVYAADQRNGSLEPSMVLIAPGSFHMGSNNGNENEKPVHEVRISYAFEISKTEITQAQWESVMNENPSFFSQCGDNCPVENVSWQDAIRFIKFLNIKTGKEYRLPTEAEWEYACQAGGNNEYCGGNDVHKVGWYYLDSGAKTKLAGRKFPNAWGLHDMSGNVWEWTQDCWNDSYNGAPADGSAWGTGNCALHVLRGGSWANNAPLMRAADRGFSDASTRNYDIGIRIARTLP